MISEYTHQRLRDNSNLALEVETSPAAADASLGGLPADVDVDGLRNEESVLSGDASVVSDRSNGTLC